MISLVRMYHGSHLYGTASPASDVDYKGVALADTRDVLLGRIPRVVEQQAPAKRAGEKNQADDVDLQVFSLHYFIGLALKGETVAMDMLHAPRSKCQVWTDDWQELRDNRHRFYTRSMKSLVGYARSQAAKYGLRGSRLGEATRVMQNLRAMPPESRIGDRVMVTGEHSRWLDPGTKDNGLRLYQVCGMSFPANAKAGYVADRVALFVDSYGKRARLAEQNQGVDWKAISHAFRAAYQVRSILLHGGFEYPLPETPHLVALKAGACTYAKAGPQLEDLVDTVGRLADASQLPSAPDAAWAEAFLIGITRKQVDAT